MDRLAAAEAAMAAIADRVFAVLGVFGLEAGPAEVQGGAFAVTIWAEDAGAVEAAMRTGHIPASLPGEAGELPVRVATGRPEPLAAHTGIERPMRPGASIGRSTPRNAGTYGARVVAGGAVRAITAGHVLGRIGSIVTQPGRRDRPGAARIGRVAANPYRVAARRDDVALIEADAAGNLGPLPHDSPQPSPADPAAGLLIFGVVGAGGPALPMAVMFMDMAHALGRVGAAMPQAGSVAQAAVGEEVRGSGRTSGPIRAKVVARGQYAAPGGARFPGFSCRPPAGQRGDSGAVVTVSRGREVPKRPPKRSREVAG